MLLDVLATLDPSAETSAADLTVTLLEVMAQLGDVLNYRLDRVSTEAWLGTARRRATVTRHARLVDFPVPPAISAASVVQVQVAHPGAGPVDASFVVLPGDTATDSVADPRHRPRREQRHPGAGRAGHSPGHARRSRAVRLDRG